MASRKPAEPKAEQKPDENAGTGPATTHRFIGETPLIFPDLHHGTVHVVRAHPDPDAAAEPETGIIVLRNGDEVTLPDDYEHAWLERINQPDEGDSTGKEQQS